MKEEKIEGMNISPDVNWFLQLVERCKKEGVVVEGVVVIEECNHSPFMVEVVTHLPQYLLELAKKDMKESP